MPRNAFRPALLTEKTICAAILADPALLALCTRRVLAKKDFQLVVDTVDAAEAANAQQGGALKGATGQRLQGDVAGVLAREAEIREALHVALADAQDALKAKPDAALARDVAAAHAAWVLRGYAAERKPAAERKSKKKARTRAADAVLTEAEQLASLLASLKSLAPYLNNRGVKKADLDALAQLAASVEDKQAGAASGHAAARQATLDEHACVADALRAWSKVAPTLYRLRRTEPKVAALLK